jgi:hypothetical protein
MDLLKIGILIKKILLKFLKNIKYYNTFNLYDGFDASSNLS